MKERPILFSAPMVRAILDGRKTQTRRVVKPQPHPVPPTGWYVDAYNKTDEWSFWGPRGTPDQGKCTLPLFKCPYGKTGDRLWVRETCHAQENSDGADGIKYMACGSFAPIENNQSAADDWVKMYSYRGQKGATVPPIHMPRWASRIDLEITGVRVERLQNISKTDCIAEGMDGLEDIHAGWHQSYAELWEKINGPDSWADNPWVWVVEFRRIKP